MNKLLSIFIGLLVSLPAFAYDYDLAVVAGSPDQTNVFVNDLLKERVTLVDSKYSDMGNYTDGIFYFAWKNHVQSALSVEILSKNGSAQTQDLMKGIEESAARVAVVLVSVGPPQEEICQLFAKYPDTVFLAGLGSDGVRFDDSRVPSCRAANALFVAGLNADLSDLNANQSWGELARVAVPYAGLDSPVDRRTSRTHGMAMVAGKMAAILSSNPQLRGAALVDNFLGSATVYLPSLNGKIGGARALVDFER